MSAFLVHKSTIDRILTGLEFELRDNHWLQDQMERMTGISYHQIEWKGKLGKMMLNMNQEALGQRYGDAMVTHAYEYYPELGSFIQYLKSLQCFTYQCAEGNIPSTALYKFFDELVEKAFMKRIIYSMAEYDKAQWA